MNGAITLPAWLAWSVALSLPPILAFYVNVFIRQRDILRQVEHLVYMHENPEKTGFGTVGLKEAIVASCAATRELTHYIRWFAEKSVGEKPPPYVRDKPLED